MVDLNMNYVLLELHGAITKNGLYVLPKPE